MTYRKFIKIGDIIDDCENGREIEINSINTSGRAALCTVTECDWDIELNRPLPNVEYNQYFTFDELAKFLNCRYVEAALYWIEARETGDLIESAGTLEEAKKILEEYEQSDRKEGTFQPDFYEIRTPEGDLL